MTEPWFDPRWSFLPGTLLGAIGGSGIGILAGVLAPAGKAKTLVFGFNTVCFVVSVTLLIAAIAAVVAGQPYAIWYGMLLPGILGTILFGGGFFLLRARYREAELRQMQARDL